MNGKANRNLVLGYLCDLGINANINLCTRECLLENINISESDLDDIIMNLHGMQLIDINRRLDVKFATARINSDGILYAETNQIR